MMLMGEAPLKLPPREVSPQLEKQEDRGANLGTD